MSPEAQRIAIAEACGHKNIAKHLVCEGTGMDFEEWYSGIPDKGGYALPDYLHSLEAMHEAEMVLAMNIMNLTVYCVSLLGMYGETGAVTATAAQRAEAFLRTIGKWTDSALSRRNPEARP